MSIGDESSAISSNADEEETAPTMTWEAIGEIAWEVGGKSIQKWEAKFNEVSQNHNEDIRRSLERLAILYGRREPQEITVDLYHNPIPNNANGGPTNNIASFAARFPAIETMGDVMYRMPLYEEEHADQMATANVTQVLHEVQHEHFQSPEFVAYVDEILANNPQIQQSIEILERNGLSIRAYANEPLELLTTYLENLTVLASEGGPETSHEKTPVLKFRADKQRQTEFMRIEATLTKEGEGPTKFVDAWREIVAEKAGISVEAPKVRPLEDGDGETNQATINVYQLGHRLPAALAHEYAQQGRQIDEDFIVRLFALAENELRAD
jgi:hypothetical protein